MHDEEPIFWPVSRVVAAFRARELSPVELTRRALERIALFDGRLHGYLAVTAELALEQAESAERLYRERDGDLPPLTGIPISIKDLFDVRGEPTSLGSRVYRGTIAREDSEAVARLRRAGAVFLGKSNTPEFGQSATTENELGPACTNPWDPGRTSGGSSGGAAAGVGAGLASVALGSDGGGSIRIPAAMCGLFGIKPTLDVSTSERSFRAMTDFVCPGPLARSAADARVFLAVLLARRLRAGRPGSCRIAWCAAPEGHPVDPGVRGVAARAVEKLVELGHRVDEVSLPVDGWMDAFGPLVLADEWRYRRHLLDDGGDGLTDYARRTIEAAEKVTDEEVDVARRLKEQIRARVVALFDRYELIVTPATATVAFPVGERPSEIDGCKVGWLWGPFPFTAPFNVSGSPAASVPVGVSDGLPVGLQVVGPDGSEERILDLCEQLEGAIEFPGKELAGRWSEPQAVPLRIGRAGVGAPATTRVAAAVVVPASTVAPSDGELAVGREGSVAVLRFDRPAKRNALTCAMLERLPGVLREQVVDDAVAVVLTGGEDVFSAGVDLAEIGNGIDDLRVDDAIAAVTAAIRDLAIPVIAAIEGPCCGAALDIAVACDVRVAGEGASFSIPAARLGLLYRPKGIADLVSSLGRETVSRLLILGDRITAEEAGSMRVVSRLVERGGALAAALELANQGAGSPIAAVTATKQLINHVATNDQDLSDWQQVRAELLASDARRQSVADAKARLGVASVTDAPG